MIRHEYEKLDAEYKLAQAVKAQDLINKPNHYTAGSIEVLDFIEAWDLDFCAGNVIKYVSRSPYKGSELQDLKKAKFYIERIIQKLESE